VNGDGYADVIVGADFYDNGQVNEGRAFVFYGNGGAGLSVRPGQRQSDDSAPIAHLGRSSERQSFRLAALGRSPFGRGRVRLQWEVKPLATPLDGSGTQAATGWSDSGTAGAALNELISGLSPSTMHHWRVRLLYHPATTPFQGASRWFTIPWNGWQEADLRTFGVADFSVVQSDSPDPVVLGDEVAYTAVVSSAGPDPADVSLRDALPAGFSFVSAAPSQGGCTESANVVTCHLGRMVAGGQTTVSITVRPTSAGVYSNVITIFPAVFDPEPTGNSSSEPTTVLNRSIGDRVWEDRNGNGIQDAGEPGVVSALVYLFNAGGTLLDVTFTDSSGRYHFDVVPGSYFVRFIPPSGFVLSPRDQGADDALDSDADPATGNTPVFSPMGVLDTVRWDAGVVPSVACVPPDEPIYIYTVTLTTDGNNYPILHFMDPNQPDQITGYNVYRSSDRSLPFDQWPLVASDVIDMDEATPNKQWVDTSGSEPPVGGAWFYQVTAFNHRCPAEGPR
jgi:uncharacterized repeat protein (TIGR01451 family)